VSVTTFTTLSNSVKANSESNHLSHKERLSIAIQAISNTESITNIALENDVSRKTVYSYKKTASKVLNDAFEEKIDDKKVLFTLPVTKDWIKQLVLSLSLSGHSSYRGIQEILEGCFDYHIGLGTVHNIIRSAIEVARAINDREDLSSIQVGAHDEIYQANHPVLVGCDPKSLYCYLLAVVDSCDSDTWGCHLLDLEAKGMQLDYTVADFGKPLRAGQREAWPNVPCHGDIFHAEMALGKVVRYLDNRAKSAVSTLEIMENRMKKAVKKFLGHKLSRKLGSARTEAKKALNLASNIRILKDWLQEILSPIGPSFGERQELFDFIVQELKVLEKLCSYRISPVRKTLENHRDELLSFSKIIDDHLVEIAKELDISLYHVQQAYILQGLSYSNSNRYKIEKCLRSALGGRFYALSIAIEDVASTAVLASSSVENLNSRLRNYFFLRKSVGPDSLELLRFFLNHRRFPRSACEERVGHSPAEMLTGADLPHWLEILGFSRFQRCAA